MTKRKFKSIHKKRRSKRVINDINRIVKAWIKDEFRMARVMMEYSDTHKELK